MAGEHNSSEGVPYIPPGEPIARMSLFGEAARKADEIRATLKRLLGEIESSNLRREGIRVSISLDPTLKIVVLPKDPIKIHHKDIDIVEMSREAQVLEEVSVPVRIPTEGPFELSMMGKVAASQDLSAEFDPLNPHHDILVFEEALPPGLKHEGGVRLTSHSEIENDTQVQVLEFQIH